MKTREDVLQIGAIGRVDPASLLHFFPQLHRRDRLLSQLGWSLIMFAGLFSVLFVTNPVLVGGVNAWIKPIKFNMSFGMYAWTVGLVVRVPAPQGEDYVGTALEFLRDDCG